MEACYGEDITKTQLLKMKRAIAKCSKIDMPELDLPMFKSKFFEIVKKVAKYVPEVIFNFVCTIFKIMNNI